jgi:hypothetical protein
MELPAANADRVKSRTSSTGSLARRSRTTNAASAIAAPAPKRRLVRSTAATSSSTATPRSALPAKSNDAGRFIAVASSRFGGSSRNESSTTGTLTKNTECQP